MGSEMRSICGEDLCWPPRDGGPSRSVRAEPGSGPQDGPADAALLDAELPLRPLRRLLLRRRALRHRRVVQVTRCVRNSGGEIAGRRDRRGTRSHRPLESPGDVTAVQVRRRAHRAACLHTHTLPSFPRSTPPRSLPRPLAATLPAVTLRGDVRAAGGVRACSRGRAFLRPALQGPGACAGDVRFCTSFHRAMEGV